MPRLGIMPVRNDYVPRLSVDPGTAVQRPLGASSSGGAKPVAFAIGYCLRVTTYPGTASPTENPRADIWTLGLPLCLAPPVLQRFHRFFSAVNLPELWE